MKGVEVDSTLTREGIKGFVDVGEPGVVRVGVLEGSVACLIDNVFVPLNSMT